MSDRYPAKLSLWPVQLALVGHADVDKWMFGWFRWPIGWDPPQANVPLPEHTCHPRWYNRPPCGRECPASKEHIREVYGLTIALGLSMMDARRFRREQRLQAVERA